MDDAPIRVNGQEAWLLDQVGRGFQALWFVDAPPTADALAQLHALQQAAVPVTTLLVSREAIEVAGWTVLQDVQGWLARRYDATPGTLYLLRPDQHVVARWRTLNMASLQAALARALGGHVTPASAHASAHATDLPAAQSAAQAVARA